MDTNSYKLKPIANKESLTHPDSTMGSGPSFSVASHGSNPWPVMIGLALSIMDQQAM